jgi:hypothetical protein
MNLRIATLTLCLLAPLTGCAMAGSRPAAGGAPSDAPAWYDDAPAGALVARASAEASSALIAEALATDDARAALSLLVEAAITDLINSLRPAVIALGDDGAQLRFENARYLAASETLRAAERTRVEAYLDPDGRYRAFAVLAADADEPARRLHDELRRIDGLAERLAGDDAWRSLAARADARRAEIAADSPLPPVGGR